MKIKGTFKVLARNDKDGVIYLTLGDAETFDKFSVSGLDKQVGEVLEFNDYPVSIQQGKYQVLIKPQKGVAK